MAGILTRQMSPSDPRWNAFLEANAEAGIFHHPAWSQLMAECYGYRPFVFALSGANEILTAGVPLMEVNSPLTGKRWVSLPFSDHCVPLTTDDKNLSELVKSLAQIAEQAQIPSLELRGVYPALPSLHTQTRFVLHEIDLCPGEEWIWKKTHEMHRRNIKIAQENDVKILEGETEQHLADFYHLHLLTRRRQGVPIQPWSFFKNLQRLLLDRGLGFLLLAYRNRECLAGAIFLHWKETLTYKYGASRDDGLKYRPNNLVMWTAIQKGCENGFSRFDLGRTDLDNTGLRAFKSRWGAKETPLVYACLGNGLNHAETGGLMRYMNLVLQKSPAWVCRLTGELLYKHFG